MAYVIPQPMLTYNQPSPVLPSRTFELPKEGRRMIPVEIMWPGPTVAKSFSINVNGIATQPFSQIVMLDVDNDQSGADVSFFFADSQDTLDVPACTSGLFPVFTQQLQMYVTAPLALATDVTRFRILNYRQDPIALPPPQFSQVSTGLSLTGVGTTALLGPTISGTLTGYSLNGSWVGNGGGGSSWKGKLVDHVSGAVIDQADIFANTATSVSGIYMNATDTAIRFAGGLDFVITEAGVLPFLADIANISIRYRRP